MVIYFLSFPIFYIYTFKSRIKSMFYINGSITIYNYLFASYLCEFAYIRHKNGKVKYIYSIIFYNVYAKMNIKI